MFRRRCTSALQLIIASLVRERVLAHPREVVHGRRHQAAEDVSAGQRQQQVHPPEVGDGRAAADKDEGRRSRGRVKQPKALRQSNRRGGGEGDSDPIRKDAQEAWTAEVMEENGDASGDEAADDGVAWLGERAGGRAKLAPTMQESNA